MKTKDFKALNQGDKVIHKFYGVCTFESMHPTVGGVYITPFTDEGMNELNKQTGTPNGKPLLEPCIWLIKHVPVTA